MRYQEKGWSCGPASVLNACRALGRHVSERKIRALAEASSDGCDSPQLISAIRGLGLSASVHHGADVSAAWSFVVANVSQGRPCIICIDHWRHWVCVIGLIGGSVIIADSTYTRANQRENGVHVMSRMKLCKTWRCSDEDRPFYAIAVGK